MALIAALLAILPTASARAATSPVLTVGAAWSKPDGRHTLTGLYAGTQLTYTLTNDSSGTLDDVAFTGTLAPARLLEFSPAGAVSFSDCGSTPRPSAVEPSRTTIRLADLTLTPSPAPACTITVDVLGTAAGIGVERLGTVSYATTAGGPKTSAGVTRATGVGVNIIANPAIRIVTPRPGGTYAYGSVVRATYGCRQSGLDFAALTGCLGYGGLGDELAPGDYLDTLVPGDRSLAVFASNIGDGFSERVVDYTVAAPAISAVRSPDRAPLRYSIRLPVAGDLQTLLLHGRRVVARLRTRVTHGGVVRPAVRPNALGRHLLVGLRRRARREQRRWARHHHGRHRRLRVPALAVTLHVSYAPSSSAIVASRYFTRFAGRTVSASRRVRLR